MEIIIPIIQWQDAIIPARKAIGMSIRMLISGYGSRMPHWSEALDKSSEINEAAYFTLYVYRGDSPPSLNLVKLRDSVQTSIYLN